MRLQRMANLCSVNPHTTEVACFLLPMQGIGSPLGGSDSLSSLRGRLSAGTLTGIGPHQP